MGGSRLSDGRIAVVNQGTQEVRWYDSAGDSLGAPGAKVPGRERGSRGRIAWHALAADESAAAAQGKTLWSQTLRTFLQGSLC